MKNLFTVLLMAAAFTASAQYSADENFSGRLRAGVGYTHDFPGLHGLAENIEYSFPLNEWLQGSAGLRRVQTAGYPRTSTVKEYTKATALDVSLLFVPFHTDRAAFRVGTGYSFSFYKTRRTYPVYASHTDPQATPDIAWPVKDASGRVSGLSLTAEYEYYITPQISAGAKVSVAKAFGSVVMAGPILGIKL